MGEPVEDAELVSTQKLGAMVLLMELMVCNCGNCPKYLETKGEVKHEFCTNYLHDGWRIGDGMNCTLIEGYDVMSVFSK